MVILGKIVYRTIRFEDLISGETCKTWGRGNWTVSLGNEVFLGGLWWLLDTFRARLFTVPYFSLRSSWMSAKSTYGAGDGLNPDARPVSTYETKMAAPTSKALDLDDLTKK